MNNELSFKLIRDVNEKENDADDMSDDFNKCVNNADFMSKQPNINNESYFIGFWENFYVYLSTARNVKQKLSI